MWSVWFFSQIFIAYFINLFVFSKCTYLTDFLSVYSYLNLNSKTLNSCRDKLGIIGLVVILPFQDLDLGLDLIIKILYYLVHGDFTKDSVP